MSDSQKYIPVCVNTDLSENYFNEFTAKFLKNVTTYSGTTDISGAQKLGSNAGVLKPLQSNEIYCDLANEPDAGQNICVGAKGFPQVNRVYVFCWNPNGNHFIYRINGDTRSCEMVKIDPCFNFQLDPKYFIHDAGCWLEVFTLVDPDTNEKLVKEELYWTDGFNYQGYLRPQDCIDTNGFDEVQYPYFVGDYDRCNVLRMGLPTPKDCIQVEEIAVPELYEDIHTAVVLVNGVATNTIIMAPIFGILPIFDDRLVISNAGQLSGTYTVISASLINAIPPPLTYYQIIVQEPVPTANIGNQGTVTLQRRVNNDGVSNNLLFNTWQFRIDTTDVWGRISEWGIISDMYIPIINDCISVGSNLPSCLNLIFNAGNPFINSIDISWRNCNDELWKKEDTIFLYTGSNIGKWWLRQRNPDIDYNPTTNRITYKFCRDKECDPVPVEETNRLQNPLPKKSQSLFKLNNRIACANNTDGFNPISKEQLDKIKLTVIPPGAANPDTRTITIYVAIDDMHQQVFPRNDKYYYGGQANGGLSTVLCDQKKQFFKNNQQSGFCGVLVNGPSAISTQVYIDGAGNVVDDPTFNGYNLSPSHRTMQKFVYTNVPKGSYIFYITAALSDPSTDSDFRKTSVPVYGTVPFNRLNDFSLNLTDRTSFPSCELLIDCCAGDYDGLTDNKMLSIVNMANQFIYAQSGYVSESTTVDTRWELLKVQNQGVASAISSIRTDRNGFYWIYRVAGIPGSAFYTLLFYAWIKCQRVNRGFNILASSPNITLKDYTMEEIFVAGYQPAICNTIEIKGRLLLNNTSIGVSNATVALTRGGEAVTDNDGYFTLICHDDASNETPYGLRLDKLILSGGACTYYSLLPSGCLPVFDISITACAYTGGICNERVVSVGLTELIYLSERGLLSGGTYLPRANFYDWLGRKTFSQPLKPLQIPSIIQSQAIGPSTVRVDIDPTFIVPSEFKYFTISLTEETTIDKYITWIVDRVEFIDNTNQINNIAPTQIKIYYQSITEFAAVNNYNVTTAWQIIPQGQSMPVTSDKVQFWLNGDGKFFTKNIIALVKYAQDGVYFTIDYTTDLKKLSQNALMRLFRPKTCTGTEPDFEVCNVVDLVNGKATVNQFTLNAFDTYYLSRQIPVPAPVAPTPTIIQIATQVNNVTTYTQPVPSATVLENRILGYRFEHDSPSNFWGDGCKNIGRPNAKNPYECELVHPNQIAFGGTLSVNGQLNYLSYFSVENKHDVEISDTSGIVAVIPFTGLLHIITQMDNLTIGFNDNLARLNADNTLQVPSGANTFGKPERKVGDFYGCNLKDKMSIKVRDGLIMWASRSRGEAVQYNFRNIKSLTKDDTLILPSVHQGKCDAMFRAKVKAMDSDPARYFTATIDPVTNRYLLTDFKLDDLSYINQLRDYSPSVNETLQFDILTTDFNGWLSFTAENYAFLDGNILSNQLFAFNKAKAYSHYNVNTNNSYNVFFGVQCEKVIWLVANAPAFKKKKWLSIANYCKQSKYFADLIVTEAGQQSALYLDNFDQADFFSFAPFMCDINTIPEGTAITEPLYEGNQLYGLWISVRLISDPSQNNNYSEFVGSVIEFFNDEKTG